MENLQKEHETQYDGLQLIVVGSCGPYSRAVLPYGQWRSCSTPFTTCSTTFQPEAAPRPSLLVPQRSSHKLLHAFHYLFHNVPARSCSTPFTTCSTTFQPEAAPRLSLPVPQRSSQKLLHALHSLFHNVPARSCSTPFTTCSTTFQPEAAPRPSLPVPQRSSQKRALHYSYKVLSIPSPIMWPLMG